MLSGELLNSLELGSNQPIILSNAIINSLQVVLSQIFSTKLDGGKSCSYKYYLGDFHVHEVLFKIESNGIITIQTIDDERNVSHVLSQISNLEIEYQKTRYYTPKQLEKYANLQGELFYQVLIYAILRKQTITQEWEKPSDKEMHELEFVDKIKALLFCKRGKMIELKRINREYASLTEPEIAGLDRCQIQGFQRYLKQSKNIRTSTLKLDLFTGEVTCLDYLAPRKIDGSVPLYFLTFALRNLSMSAKFQADHPTLLPVVTSLQTHLIR